MNSPTSILFDITGVPTAVSASTQPTSGALGHIVAGFDATNTVRYLKFDGDAVKVSGSFGVVGENSTNSSLTYVASSMQSVRLANANPSRKGLIITNDTATNMFIVLGTSAASSTNYTVKLPQGAYYEVPFSWIGQVNAIWDKNIAGGARITELTA